MSETLEKPAIGHVPSVEELQRLVDGPKKCNIFEHFKAGLFVRILVGIFGSAPKCDQLAVAHYEISCDSCKMTVDLWLCAEHERRLLEGAASGEARNSATCEMHVRKL